VAPLAIVVGFDIVEDGVHGLLSRLEAVEVNKLLLQRCEETFGDGVVPAVASSAHASRDAPGLERSNVVVTCILASAVGVMDELTEVGPLAPRERIVESLERQLIAHVIGDRPTNHTARCQVKQ